MSGEVELRVVVVDDEPLARDFVCGVVQGAPGVQVAAECGDGASAVEAIGLHGPDLVFLDIEMPEVDGFDVIRRVGVDAMPEVIFVTAHRQHTLRAFEVHAVDYVVKPCEPQRILAALEHARARVLAGRVGRFRESLGALLQALRPLETDEVLRRPTRLTVRDGDRVTYVELGEVDWLEANGGDVRVHASGKAYDMRVSLRGLLEHLGPGGFVRIHRSAAVNLEQVAEVRPWGHGDWVAVLRDGRKLRVSRTHKDALLKLVH